MWLIEQPVDPSEFIILGEVGSTAVSNKQNHQICPACLPAKKHCFSFQFAYITYIVYICFILGPMSERKMWEEKEDNMIRKIVRENESRSDNQKWKWSQIAEILQTRIPGCKRSGKQCRQRWYNHLNPAIIKDKELSRAQIDKLFQLQSKMGNRWANISKQFPGRTDNNLKNFFYSSLRRAIRQINYFVGHYKKKSNIKPFKQSILTKILNISDQKYRQKLDIKSNKADDLAQNVKQMLAKLSLEEENKQLDQNDIEFREKIVKSIQEFNKNCKKRKSKRVEDDQEPDLEELSQFNHSGANSESVQDFKSPRKPQRVRKSVVKVQESSENIQTSKRPQKIVKKQAVVQKKLPKQLFQKPVKQQKNASNGTKYLRTRQSLIDQLPQNDTKFKPVESKKSSSKYDSRSSGNNQQFKLESSDFMRQSNASVGELEPRMLTRRSSSEYKSNFINNLQNWRKMESKCQDGLFNGEGLHSILDPMLESLNIGENMGKITEGSANYESGFFKMLKGDSKMDHN